MKKVLLICLFIPALTRAQEIPKETNCIVVKGISMPALINSLLDKGYTIDKMDTTYKTIQTNAKTDKNGMSYLFHIRVKDSVAMITGDLNINMSGGGLIKQHTSYDPISYRGWRTGAFRIAFGYMNDFAKSLTGSVDYAKQ